MGKRSLSLGKRRGLSQCSDGCGHFNILALDHRQAVKKVFSGSPDPYAEAVAFKRAVVRTLAPISTAVLLDPSIGAGPCLADGSLPGGCGLVVTLEASGYAGPSHARTSRLPEDWSPDRIKRMGASAVKLLVYYHPRSETAAAMRNLVARVDHDCQRLDVPLFLEILTYSPHPDGSSLSPEERIEAVVQAAADLTPLGGDVLKTEFPVDVKAQPDPAEWQHACRLLNDASAIPWVLLSAGVDYPVFAQQVEGVCKAGASGILAGRAIWKEALGAPDSERDAFLCTTGRERMQNLQQICSRYARPYFDSLESEPLAEDWYTCYAGL
jgi:tagatose-1,6-bisphosphate aldolase